jgi:hypothetical protein
MGNLIFFVAGVIVGVFGCVVFFTAAMIDAHTVL